MPCRCIGKLQAFPYPEIADPTPYIYRSYSGMIRKGKYYLCGLVQKCGQNYPISY